MTAVDTAALRALVEKIRRDPLDVTLGEMKRIAVLLEELDRLHAQFAHADKLYKEQNDRQEAEIIRLRAPHTEEEVERAARAICNAHRTWPGRSDERQKDIVEQAWRSHVPEARAALTAAVRT